MNIIVNRNYTAKQTPGRILVMDGVIEKFKAYSLELVNLNNMPNVSCVLEGRYKAFRYVHPKKGKSFVLQDVPDRSDVMWHAGNYASGSHLDTEGCTLPGRYFQDINADGNIDICDSRNTMDKLYNMMPDEFYITYTS